MARRIACCCNSPTLASEIGTTTEKDTSSCSFCVNKLSWVISHRVALIFSMDKSWFFANPILSAPPGDGCVGNASIAQGVVGTFSRSSSSEALLAGAGLSFRHARSVFGTDCGRHPEISTAQGERVCP